MHDEKILQQFDRWGKQRPEHNPHGTPEEIRANLKKAECTNWRLEGNKLMADTQYGPLIQYIPTDYICKGTGSDGLPILVKIQAN